MTAAEIPSVSVVADTAVTAGNETMLVPLTTQNGAVAKAGLPLKVITQLDAAVPVVTEPRRSEEFAVTAGEPVPQDATVGKVAWVEVSSPLSVNPFLVMTVVPVPCGVMLSGTLVSDPAVESTGLLVVVAPEIWM